jgi:hypothetical protein
MGNLKRSKQTETGAADRPEKMDRFNSKIAEAAKAAKLKEIMRRKGALPHPKRAAEEMVQAGDEAYDEVRRETRGAVESRAKGGKVSGKKWIQKAIKKPGSLRKSLGVKKGEKIPAGKLASAAKKPGKMGQRARLAKTLKGFKK